jgi:hypothetical protein
VGTAALTKLTHHIADDMKNKGVQWVYDADIDLFIDHPPSMTLKDFLNKHVEIRTHDIITDAMAERYPAMRDARRIIELRSKKAA